MRRHARVSKLQRVPRGARRRVGAACALPLLQLLGPRSHQVSALRRTLPGADRVRDRARRSRGEARLSGRAGRATRSRRGSPQRLLDALLASSATALSTCSSAHR
jgi:hypothetical protein